MTTIVARLSRKQERLSAVKTIKHKVLAYITYDNSLLVFRHPFAPEAGIQVPAGTVEVAESPEAAVLREAFEETGLSQLTLDCFLGEQERDMADFGREEVQHRRFYHLWCHGHPPSTWWHEERYYIDDATQPPILFEFFWAPLSQAAPSLIADQGVMLPRLIEALASKGK